MQTAAIALIVVLLVGMACGLEITWALGVIMYCSGSS